MPYVINNSDGSRIFYVADQGFNTETAVTLPGRNVPDYGEPVDTNFIHMLENFADGTPPQASTILTGQLWYDTSDSIMKLYNGSSWVAITNIPSSEGAPGGSVSEGNMYFDETIRKLKIYYDNIWLDTSYAGEVSTAYNNIPQGSPTLYGTRIRNIFLRRESDDRDVPVLAIVQSYDGLNSIGIQNGSVNTLYGSETLIGVLSRNPAFTVKDATTNSEEENLNWFDELNEPGGIGTLIKPGLNMRKDATAEYPIASLAQRAQTSYALNLGSYGADGANIMAANVFHHGADSLPVANLTYDLGGPDNVFAELWVDDIYLSNALIPNGDNVSIGTDENPIQNIYVNEIEIDGNLIIEGDNVTIGGNTAPVDAIFVNSAYVYETLSVGNVEGDTNYVFPSSRSGNARLVCDDDGQLYWLDNGAVYNNIAGGLGVDIRVTTDPYPGSINIFNRQARVDLRLGQGIGIDNDGNISIDFTEFTTCDITEGTGCSNFWYSDERVYNMLTASVEQPYDTGLQTREPTPGDYQLRIHGGASRVVGTINAPSDSAIIVTQNRTNRDAFGFNEVELDVALGPAYPGDGVTGVPIGPDGGLLKDPNGEVGLDWLAVADNLFTNDLADLPTGTVKAGKVGIKRVSGNPTAPTTHVLYIESIDSIGGGDADKIMFKNKANEMEGSGAVNFGGSTNRWSLQTKTVNGQTVNSSGRMRHSGSVFLYSAGSSNNGSLVADGDVTAFRQNTSSDARLKKNISTIDHGLEKVNAMRGVSYELLRDNTRNVGVIAQEMEEVVPEVVTEGEDGMKAVNYGALVGVLIEAVKELTQEVETLKAKLGD